MTVYPFSTPPGAVLGYTKHGRPIHPVAGGSGEGEGDGGSSTTDTVPAPAADPSTDGGAGNTDTASDTTPAGTSTAGEPAGNGTGNADTGRAIAAIREDFKAERRKRQEAEKRLGDIQAALDADRADRARQTEQLAIALGLKSGDEPPDPAKLAEELAAARADAQAEIAKRDALLRGRTVELAVLQAAARHQADGQALLDSRSFLNTLTNLDPDGPEFGADVDDAITKALAAQPRYKTAAPAAAATEPTPKPTPTIARSGGEHTAPGGNRQWTDEDCERASPAQMVEAIEQGLLTDLGYFPRRKRR